MTSKGVPLFLHDNIRACMHVAAQRPMFLRRFELLMCSSCTEVRLGHFGASPGPCKWPAQGVWSYGRPLGEWACLSRRLGHYRREVPSSQFDEKRANRTIDPGAVCAFAEARSRPRRFLLLSLLTCVRQSSSCSPPWRCRRKLLPRPRRRRLPASNWNTRAPTTPNTTTASPCAMGSGSSLPYTSPRTHRITIPS